MAGQEMRGEDWEAGGEFTPGMGHLAVGTEPISQGTWEATPTFSVLQRLDCGLGNHLLHP